LIGNLEREELNPADEAEAVAALTRYGLTAEELSARIARSAQWVQLRLALGDMPAEVLAEVRSRRLAMGSVAELARVPKEEQERAVQVVLHPEFQVEPLGPGAAKQVLEDRILRPWQLRSDWERSRVVRAEAWRKALWRVGVAKLEIEWLEWDARADQVGGTPISALAEVSADLCVDGKAKVWGLIAESLGVSATLVPMARFSWAVAGDDPPGPDPECVCLVSRSECWAKNDERPEHERLLVPGVRPFVPGGLGGGGGDDDHDDGSEGLEMEGQKEGDDAVDWVLAERLAEALARGIEGRDLLNALAALASLGRVFSM